MKNKCSFELFEYYFKIKSLPPEQRFHALNEWEKDIQIFLKNRYSSCEVVKLSFVL